MPGIDINRTTQGVRLDPVPAAEIWSATDDLSAAMQLAEQIPLPGSGVAVDIITGEPEAAWVAETDEKPVSRPTLDSRLMQPYMLAVIVPFSNQFRRDKARLYTEIQRKTPQALARKFDQTVFGDVEAPGSNFDKLSEAPAVTLDPDVYDGIIAADQAVAAAGGLLNGWAVSPQGRGLLLSARDTTGRPLLVNDLNGTNIVSSILGSPVSVSRGVFQAGNPPQLGFAGDWTGAAWGSVEGITMSLADQATLTDGDETINLWQRNMFAIRFEVELGFRVRDVTWYVKLTGAAAT
jgi:HK97 family phage major capsid protein